MDKNGAEAQKKLLRYSSAFASALEKKGGGCLQRRKWTEKISAGWMEPISHSAKAAKNAAVIRVIPGFWNEIIFVIRWESSWKAMNDFDLYMDSV